MYSDQYIEFVEFFGDIEWIEKERNPNQWSRHYRMIIIEMLEILSIYYIIYYLKENFIFL